MQDLERERFLTDTRDVDVGIALLARQTGEVTIGRQTLHGPADRVIRVSVREVKLPIHVTGRSATHPPERGEDLRPQWTQDGREPGR